MKLKLNKFDFLLNYRLIINRYILKSFPRTAQQTWITMMKIYYNCINGVDFNREIHAELVNRTGLRTIQSKPVDIRC